MLENKTLLITGNSEQACVLDFVAKESTVLAPINTFPEDISFATGGVIQGIPFIIGGETQRGSWKIHNTCRKLTSEGWHTFAQLKTARSAAASVVLQDNQIWVTGGDYQTKTLKSTEIINMKTNGSKEGPDLPTEIKGHAMAKVDENYIYIIGGSSYKNYTQFYTKNCWIYDQHSFEFTSGPEMNDARSFFGWGIFSSSLHNGRQCLLVAGGRGTGGRLSSAEILDFTQPNATWTRSNGLSIYSLFI